MLSRKRSNRRCPQRHSSAKTNWGIFRGHLMGELNVRLGHTLSQGQMAGSCVIVLISVYCAVLVRLDPGNCTVALSFQPW